MSNILLATDGSKPSLRAEDYLSKSYDPSDDDIIIVSVAYVPNFLFGYLEFGNGNENPYETESGKKFVQQAEERAKDSEQRLSAEGFNVEIIVRNGKPGAEICEVAEEKSIDCIVVGRRGHSSDIKPLLGSVSQYVLHHAPCPVNVVPQKEY